MPGSLAFSPLSATMDFSFVHALAKGRTLSPRERRLWLEAYTAQRIIAAEAQTTASTTWRPHIQVYNSKRLHSALV